MAASQKDVETLNVSVAKMLQYLKKVILDYLLNDKNKVNYLAGKKGDKDV